VAIGIMNKMGFEDFYHRNSWLKNSISFLSEKSKISRVPDLGQGKNESAQIWLDLERREFVENLALLSEEFKFWSFLDPARSELFRNLTITHYFVISH